MSQNMGVLKVLNWAPSNAILGWRAKTLDKCQRIVKITVTSSAESRLTILSRSKVWVLVGNESDSVIGHAVYKKYIHAIKLCLT